MFIWSCAIYRFYKTHTHRHTYTHFPYIPGYTQASRDLHKMCITDDNAHPHIK